MKNQMRDVSGSRLLALLLCAALMLGMLPMAALADQTGGLTVKLKNYEDLPTGPEDQVEVTLYQIGKGAPAEPSGWEMIDGFESYGVIQARTSKDLADIAQTMATDVIKNGYSGKKGTLEGGKYAFTGLDLGIYLGVLTAGPEGLEADPFIVTVPSRDPETKDLRLSYDIELKASCVTEAAVKKVWNDNENQDGIRPTSLTVKLLADGRDTGKSVKLSTGNGWENKLGSLARYSKGQPVAYTWSEEGLPEGYTLTNTAASGTLTTLTNAHTPEKTEATVKKVWEDDDDQDKKRPASLTVKLLADGNETGRSVTLTADNSWSASIGELDKYKGGKQIAYTWSEEGLPEGYALTNTATSGAITTLTNTYAPEKVTVTVNKVWEDENDQDGVRPPELTVALLVDGRESGRSVTLNAGNNWSASIGGLDKYRDGVEIGYSWSEATVAGYTAKAPVVDGLVTTLTNVHTPETTYARVRKVWNDHNDQDGIRPASLTVKLLADGNETGKSVTLSAANNWTGGFRNLPKYASGAEIAYSWSEEKLPEGYALTGNVTDGHVTTLTNTHTPETTSATVQKVWDDNDDAEGARPASLTVILLGGGAKAGEVTLNAANGWSATIDGLDRYQDGAEIAYSWSEIGLPDGYALSGTATEGRVTTLTNRYTPGTTSATVQKVWDDNDDQDAIRPASLTVALSDGTKDVATVTLDAANGWTAMVDGLMKYEGDKPITYTWREVDLPDGYTLTNTSVEGTVTTLTNTHVPETVSVTVHKVWDDADDRDDMRPASLTVTLSNGQSVTLDEANEWTATIDDLPRYDKGEEIDYWWSEAKVDGYAAKATVVNNAVTTLTNVELTSVTVKKVWNDDDDRDGLRPLTLTVRLSDGQSVSLNAGNDWTATIDNLPKYDNGQEIVYTWTEISLFEGYALTDIETEGSITKLVNRHTPEITSATVRKVWNDNDNQDGIRPASLRVTLSNGTENVGTVTLNAANDWTATIEDLPRYDGSKEIVYRWTEDRLPDGYALTGTIVEGTVTTLTNSHTPNVPTTNITGQKIWLDENNAHNTRPESITVQLYADGALVNATPTWTGTGSDTWTYAFNNLPARTDAGATIQYTVREITVEGYESILSGLAFTNRLIPREPREYKEISGVKTWEDDDNAGRTRPNYVVVHLLRNGEEIASRTVTAATNWAYSFGMQPVDDGYGNLYRYEIREDGVPGYFSRVDGMNLINTSLSRTPNNPDTPNIITNSRYTPTGQTVASRTTGTQVPPFGEQDTEELVDLFDYNTPLWGELLGTGDETPIYPYVFGGVGVAAVIALLVFGRKRKKGNKRS